MMDERWEKSEKIQVGFDEPEVPLLIPEDRVPSMCVPEILQTRVTAQK